MPPSIELVLNSGHIDRIFSKERVVHIHYETHARESGPNWYVDRYGSADEGKNPGFNSKGSERRAEVSGERFK